VGEYLVSFDRMACARQYGTCNDEFPVGHI